MLEERAVAKLTRERDNARRERDEAKRKFAEYQHDKQIVDKALWLLAHDFVQAAIEPLSMPRIPTPRSDKEFMSYMETVVTKALLAAKNDKHQWSDDSERIVVRSSVPFVPPERPGETRH